MTPDDDRRRGSDEEAADADRVREALREVVDPCSAATGSNLDVVEMGLVERVAVDGGRVEVDLRLTTPTCHMIPYFVESVEAAVGPLPGVESVDLSTDDGLAWSADMLSESARRKRAAVLGEREARFRREHAGESG